MYKVSIKFIETIKQQLVENTELIKTLTDDFSIKIDDKIDTQIKTNQDIIDMINKEFNL